MHTPEHKLLLLDRPGEAREALQQAVRAFDLRLSCLARRIKRLGSVVELPNHLGDRVSPSWRTLRSARARRN